MKFTTPTIDSLKKQGINTGGLFVGIAAGWAMKEFLMKERTGSDGVVKKSIIPDTALTNGLAAVVGIGLAASFAGNTFVSFIALGFAVMFAIRTVNIITEGTKVAGINGMGGTMGDFFKKWIPNLRGIEGSYDAPDYNLGQFVNEPTMLPIGYIPNEDMGYIHPTAMLPANNTPVAAGYHA